MPASSSYHQPPTELPLAALLLERKQGFGDRAVIGGVGSLISRWARAGAVRQDNADLRSRLVKLAQVAGGYPKASVKRREAIVTEAERLAAQLAELPASPARPSRPAPVPPSWRAPLDSLSGIGAVRAAKLANAGLRTLADLLQTLPFRYEDRREFAQVATLEHRQVATVLVEVTGPGQLVWRNRKRLATVPAADETGQLTLAWFNQPYRASQLPPGTRLLVTGQVRLYRGAISLAVSESEVADEETQLRQIVPVYSAPPFSQVVMRKLVRAALAVCADIPEDRLPQFLVRKRKLIPLAEALHDIHFPPDPEHLQQARARLAYEELFLLQVRLALRRQETQAPDKQAALEVGDSLALLEQALSFALTVAQRRVMAEIAEDLSRPQAANRLIHGDVGSGKTVVAAAALVAAVRAGRQAALMAPTELLAEQHQRTLSALLEPLGIQPVLLTGSLPPAERRVRLGQLAAGEVALVVGTHALFQEKVIFADLAVAVIDEQHRFGVRQRGLLAGKGQRPNTFIMSATPIPRTLALTAYGDFDLSVLDEMPPGRKPVHTTLVARRDLRQAYETVANAVLRGRQAYLVCPLVEASSNRHLMAAEALFEDLTHNVFPSLKLGLVHGQMENAQREAVMERFRAGEMQALVATTVIEVGVDIPRATVMVVLNAERFGLAQLHQLRGRVARGEVQGNCLLVTGVRAPEVIERLQVLEQTADGFRVAEEDLKRRGPGELAGWRQSGLPDPRMSELLADTPTLARAREDAFALIAEDPHLDRPEHHALRQALGEFKATGEWTL